MVKIYLGAFYHQTYTMWAVVATAAGGAAAVALAASIVSCCRDPPVKTGYVVACALMNTAAAVAFAVFAVEAAEEAQTLLRGAQPLAHIYSSCGCTVQAIQVTAESLVNNPLPMPVTTATTVAIVALGLPIASFMFVLAIGRTSVATTPLIVPAAAAAALAVMLLHAAAMDPPKSLRFLVNSDPTGYKPPQGCNCAEVTPWTEGGNLKPTWDAATHNAQAAAYAAAATALLSVTTVVLFAIAPRGGGK